MALRLKDCLSPCLEKALRSASAFEADTSPVRVLCTLSDQVGVQDVSSMCSQENIWVLLHQFATSDGQDSFLVQTSTEWRFP